ncbi:MAG: cob(I)yrinic acid a,c-diamide adenosyltransferase [Gammaproteobacteria bacterium]
MGNRLSKIYTRTGDGGDTGLSDGSRVDKDSARVTAMGDVDELNSVIGMVLCQELSSPVRECLTDVQHDLFNIGGELSIPGHSLVSADDVERLETTLDGFNDALPPLDEFILPGGGEAAAACHLARTVCRRAERSIISLAREEDVSQQVRQYLNRLSDLLFVLCRVTARESGHGEVFWRSSRTKGSTPTT